MSDLEKQNEKLENQITKKENKIEKLIEEAIRDLKNTKVGFLKGNKDTASELVNKWQDKKDD